MKDQLVVRDREDVLHITYEDMVKYHGRFHIGGVALAFRVLEMAFSLLLPDGIPEREKIGFLSGVGSDGRGIIDGVEMVTRARSRGRMVLDLEAVRDKAAPKAPNGGCYYFEVDYDGRKVGLALKPGLISSEFTDLSRQAKTGTISADDMQRLRLLREELAQFLMSREPQAIFDVVLLPD
jgi:hypothetical protein